MDFSNSLRSITNAKEGGWGGVKSPEKQFDLFFFRRRLGDTLEGAGGVIFRFFNFDRIDS